MAESLENGHRRTAGLGEQRVAKTRDEEPDPHPLSGGMPVTAGLRGPIGSFVEREVACTGVRGVFDAGERADGEARQFAGTDPTVRMSSWPVWAARMKWTPRGWLGRIWRVVGVCSLSGSCTQQVRSGDAVDEKPR